MITRSFLLAFLTPIGLVLLALDSSATQVQVLVQAGDTLAPGVDVEDSTGSSPFHLLHVNDAGDWLVRANLESSSDQAVVRSGSLLLKSGDVAPGTSDPILNFKSYDMNDAGNILWALNLVGGASDEVVILDNTVVVRSADSTIGGIWSPGSSYIDFYEVSLNEAADKISIHAAADDPNLLGSSEVFKGLWTLNGSGAIIAEEVFARETETPIGYTAGNLLFFGAGADKPTINASGASMFAATVLNPGPGEGGTAIWLNTDGTAAGSTVIARAGAVEPTTGMTWGNLAGPEMSINDAGSWIVNTHFAGILSGGPNVLYKDGAVFRLNGDIHPAFPGRTLDNFGCGPVRLTDAGDVVWYGNFTGSGTEDAAYFRNDEVVMKENTLLGTAVVGDIRGGEGCMDASGNGRYVIFEGKLDGVYTVFLYDREALFENNCNGDGGDQLGCTNCPCGNNASVGTVGGCLNSATSSARLLPSGIPSATSDSLRFELSGAPPTAFSILNSGDAVAPTGMANPCFGLMSGVASANFDGLRCAVGNTRRHGGRPADGNGDVGVTNNGWGPPNGPAIGLIAQGGFVVGQTRHFQVIYRDDPLAVCGRGLNTSQSIGVLVSP